MRNKTFAVALFLVGVFSNSACAQKNEVAFMAGGTFSSDTTATVENIPVTFTCEPCPPFPSAARIDSKFAFEGAYGRRIVDARIVSLYLELPVLGVSERRVRPAVLDRPAPPGTNPVAAPHDFSSIFLTPSLKMKFLPHAVLAPFVSLGGGIAHYSSSTQFGPFPMGSTSNTTGALQIGGGVDIKTPFPHLGFRAEVREFWTGQPDFNPNAALDHHHNVFAGAGIVLRF